MDIREKQSLFALLATSFSVANRAGIPLIGSFVVIVLILAIPTAIDFFLQHWIVHILWKIFYSVCISWWGVTCVRIIAAKAENLEESVPDAFFNSVVPTFYGFIFNFLLGLAVGVVGLAAVFIPIVGPIVAGLVAIFFGIRLMFAKMSITLRDQNPISAFSFSWELTSGRFFEVLGITVFITLFYVCCVGVIAYAVIVGIPLYFADSFSLVNLSFGWIVTFVIISLILLFLFLEFTSFFVVWFLNLDYQENISVPVAGHAPSVPQQPAYAYQPQSRRSQQRNPQPVTFQEIPVQVDQSSVQSTEDNTEFRRHLAKVYTPRPDEKVDPTEEDRMPTILFDDDMAKQLEERQSMWKKRAAAADAARKKREEGGDDSTLSIKMSK